jgi:hypothetical protein
MEGNTKKKEHFSPRTPQCCGQKSPKEGTESQQQMGDSVQFAVTQSTIISDLVLKNLK